MDVTVTVPFLVDTGVGTASDAAIAIELGCDAGLILPLIHGQMPKPLIGIGSILFRCIPGRLLSIECRVYIEGGFPRFVQRPTHGVMNASTIRAIAFGMRRSCVCGDL